MTKEDFLTAYEAALKTKYSWAQDTGPSSKMPRYMASVRDTIMHGKNTWHCDGECVTAAYRAIGGKGKATLKALRALSDCPVTSEVTSSILPSVERELGV